MHSHVILIVCSVAVLLLMVSSTVITADDQNYGRVRKIPGGAWLAAHQYQPYGKRGRFVFREAPNAHQYDAANGDLHVDDDGQDDDVNLDKRNWRL
jgi:hypothetical protein